MSDNNEVKLTEEQLQDVTGGKSKITSELLEKLKKSGELGYGSLDVVDMSLSESPEIEAVVGLKRPRIYW